MNRSSVVLLFTIGSSFGIPLAILYVLNSSSEDRFFHGFVMLAACCVSFPAVVVFLRITLKMWEMALEQRSVLKELKDDIKPVTLDAKEVIGAVRALIDDVKNQNPGKIVEFLDKLQKDGSIQKIATSVEAIARKAHEVLERTKVREGTVIDVPMERFPVPPPHCPVCASSPCSCSSDAELVRNPL